MHRSLIVWMRQGLGAALCVAVLLGVIQPAAVAEAAASSTRASAKQTAAVRTVPVRSVPAASRWSGTGLPQVKRRPTVWPKTAAATVTVPARGTGARIGESPLWVKQSGRVPARAVTVSTLGHDVANRLGGVGVAFTVAQSSAVPPSSPGTVAVTINASGFAASTGGNLLGRLRIVARPACALTTPAAARCRVQTSLVSTVDAAAGTVSAQVPVSAAGAAGAAQVFALAAGAGSGETGTYAASPLASSAKWSVGGGSGGFSWSYPIPAVPSPGGATPDLSLNYSSQSVDGLVAAENSQPSWAGLGWDLSAPFIERRYIGCSDDLVPGTDNPVQGYAGLADNCWAGDVLELSLNGRSSPLGRDSSATGDVWRPRDDPGWRVERLTGTANGDNNGEYWKVQAPDGTTYTFGKGAQATTGRQTNSVYTVPVFGNTAGEPCHGAAVSSSWCQQAWRWNIDSTVDAHGNETSYFYTKETNNYARQGTNTTPYVRGGYISDIDYGLRAGSETATAPARMHFTTSLRCTQVAGGGATTCPALTPASPDSDYPDVPSSQLCPASCNATQASPTFFTGVLLASVTTQRSSGTGAGATWTDVDSVAFDYTYPQPTDGTSASLWLAGIRRTGKVGGSLAIPAVTFGGTELVNRVETAAPKLRKLRVTSVTDELGRQIQITYGTPDPCTDANIPAGHADQNTLDCFPGWRTNGTTSGFGWWFKYLATQVKVIDTAGGAPPRTTRYTYSRQPAWHYDDAPASPVLKKSWGDWRGYGSVDVVQLSDPASRGETTTRPLSLTRTLYFRGMDGDRQVGDPQSGPGTRHFTVTDSTGTTVNDDPWLLGRARETQRFALSATGQPAYELDGSLSSYGVARLTRAVAGTDDPVHDAHLVVPARQVQRQTVIAEPGGARSTRSTTTDTTFDSYGLPLTATTSAPGAGTAGGGSDVRCTKTSYARDTATVAAYLLSYPYQVRSYAGTCAAPGALIRAADTYYDGSATLGAPLTKADATKRTVAVTASGPNTVTSGITVSATFDAYGRSLTATDGRSNTTRTSYSPATGLADTTTVVNPLGQSTITVSDPGRQQPAAITDVNGRTTKLGYDPMGRLTSVRRSDQSASAPPAIQFVYDLDAARVKPPRVTTRRLQSGTTYVDSFEFLDSYGKPRQTQRVSPASTAGAPKTIITDSRFDDRGLTSATVLPVVATTTAGAGLIAVSPSSTSETRTSFDELARPVRDAFYAAGTLKWAITTTYFGDHVRATPPAGGTVQTTWTDVLGRTIRSDQGTGASLVSTTYRYDDADEKVRTTDPAAHAGSTTYDLVGRAVAATDPDAGASANTYDANGNLVSTRDAAGVTVTSDYDVLNRMTAVWQGASGTGTKLAAYSYDSTSIANGIGRLSSQTAYASADSGKPYTQAISGYDARGRITGKSWTFPSGTGLTLLPATYKVSYGYDESDHQTSVTYPDRVVGLDPETVTTSYDSLGYVTGLTGLTTPLIGSPASVSYLSGTGYAADGKLLTRSYANPLYPLSRQYSYEPDTQRLSNISTLVGDPIQPGVTAKQDDTYRWDPSGNLTSITDNAPQVPLIGKPTATCFAYDDLDRISHAWSTEQTDCSDGASTTVHNGPSGFNESWTYSADGNITSARSLLINRTFSYADNNHPHAVTGAGLDVFGYDAVGQQNTRVKSLQPSLMTYTPQHRLASVVTGAAISRFVYGADGQRLVRFNPDSSATLFIDGEEILVVAGIAKGTRFYSIGGTVIGQRLPTGALIWQLNDHQGSAQISVLSGTGILARTYYDPYGKVRDLSPGPATDRAFLGQVADPATGLNALGARYYDPDLGRFTTTDPLDVQGSAQLANSYSYSGNNPVMFSDPSWLEPASWCNTAKCEQHYADLRAGKTPTEPYDPETDNEPYNPAGAAPLAAGVVVPWITGGGSIGRGKLLQYANIYHDAAVASTVLAILQSPEYFQLTPGAKVMVLRFETGVPGGGRSKTKNTSGYADIMVQAKDGSVYIWEIKSKGQDRQGAEQLLRYQTALQRRGITMKNGWDVRDSYSSALGLLVSATSETILPPDSGVRTYMVQGRGFPVPDVDPEVVAAAVAAGLLGAAYVAGRGEGEGGVLGGGGLLPGSAPVPGYLTAPMLVN